MILLSNTRRTQNEKLSGRRNKQSVAIDYIVDGEQKVTVKLP